MILFGCLSLLANIYVVGNYRNHVLRHAFSRTSWKEMNQVHQAHQLKFRECDLEIRRLRVPDTITIPCMMMHGHALLLPMVEAGCCG